MATKTMQQATPTPNTVLANDAEQQATPTPNTVLANDAEQQATPTQDAQTPLSKPDDNITYISVAVNTGAAPKSVRNGQVKVIIKYPEGFNGKKYMKEGERIADEAVAKQFEKLGIGKIVK
jgi:hypothetical protein